MLPVSTITAIVEKMTDTIAKVLQFDEKKHRKAVSYDKDDIHRVIYEEMIATVKNNDKLTMEQKMSALNAINNDISMRESHNAEELRQAKAHDASTRSELLTVILTLGLSKAVPRMIAAIKNKDQKPQSVIEVDQPAEITASEPAQLEATQMEIETREP